jgi:hypothetical protein
MYKRIIIYFTIIFSCLLFNVASASNHRTKKKTRFPVGCKPIGYKFDLYNVIFTPSTKKYLQTVYFIRNKSNRTIQLLQANDGSDPYIINIDGNIKPYRWSVLSVSENKIKYICTNYDKRKNKHRVISCQNALQICEFPHTRFGTNHRGTYWLTLNKSRRSAINATRFHGILLSDPKQKKRKIHDMLFPDPKQKETQEVRI